MVSPSVPAPTTATTSPAATWADNAAWTAHAVGSIMTASWSLNDSGTAWSWLAWAISGAVDHPPPVSVQNPVWSPGSSAPKAMLPQRPVWPDPHCTQGGSMWRGAQPSTGSITARVPGASVRPEASTPPSSSTPTTSWPGTNGKLTMSSK